MDEDATWYGRRPQPRPHYVRRGPSSPPLRNGHSIPPPYGPCLLRPRSPISATAELLYKRSPRNALLRPRVKVSPHILALLFDLPSVLRDNSLSITEHFQTETENASIRATTNIVRRRCGVSVILVKFDAVMQEKCPKLYDEYSAVAEMGDRFFQNRHGPKIGGGLLCP